MGTLTRYEHLASNPFDSPSFGVLYHSAINVRFDTEGTRVL